MARWRLVQAHYINARYAEDDGPIEWEYKETDRLTGREKRKRHPVPLFIEPDCIVCRPGSEKRDDNVNSKGEGCGPILYEGEPTPHMDPLDDEARAISAQFEHKWIHPIDTLPGQGLDTALINSFQKQIDAIANGKSAAIPVAEGVSKSDFDALKKQMEELMAANAALQAEKAEAPKARRL